MRPFPLKPTSARHVLPPLHQNHSVKTPKTPLPPRAARGLKPIPNDPAAVCPLLPPSSTLLGFPPPCGPPPITSRAPGSRPWSPRHDDAWVSHWVQTLGPPPCQQTPTSALRPDPSSQLFLVTSYVTLPPARLGGISSTELLLCCSSKPALPQGLSGEGNSTPQMLRPPRHHSASSPLSCSSGPLAPS